LRKVAVTVAIWQPWLPITAPIIKVADDREKGKQSAVNINKIKLSCRMF
jgi:hypothetical protein